MGFIKRRVECKISDTGYSSNLEYFSTRLNNPLSIQVIKDKPNYIKGVARGKYIVSADRLLKILF